MSIATVVTRGFGSFGSVNRIPTLGYGDSVVLNPQFGCGHALSAYHAGATAKQQFKPGSSDKSIYHPGGTAAQKAC